MEEMVKEATSGRINLNKFNWKVSNGNGYPPPTADEPFRKHGAIPPVDTTNHELLASAFFASLVLDYGGLVTVDRKSGSQTLRVMVDLIHWQTLQALAEQYQVQGRVHRKSLISQV